MKRFAVPALLGLLATTPAFAHNGLIHEGCPTGRAFSAGDLTVTGAYTRAMLPKATVGGGYLVIENKGTAPDRLLGGQSLAAQTIQVHQMRMEGDMMKMSEVEGGLEIPAGGSVALTPGGYHLMMMNIPVAFIEGQCVQVTLKFEHAGNLPVELNIAGTAATAPPDGTAPAPAPMQGMEGMDHDNMTMAPAN